MLIGLLLVLVIGIFHALSSPDISFSFFYIIPIYLVTWFSGRRLGVVISLVSAVTWFIIAEVIPVRTYPHAFIPYWNAFVRFAFFVVMVWLETSLQDAVTCAKTDPLTNIGNRRYFFEAADLEIRKLSRYRRPVTAAYIDIDNFKAVNDNFGHDAGDRILKAVAQTVKNHIRSTDIFARLGGDEFALLLPETDAESARKLIPNLHKLLNENVTKNKMLVSFSIGAVTFVEPTDSVDEMIKIVDSLMYSAKREGNNLIKYDVFQ